jgi:hypothetical protein
MSLREMRCPPGNIVDVCFDAAVTDDVKMRAWGTDRRRASMSGSGSKADLPDVCLNIRKRTFLRVYEYTP